MADGSSNPVSSGTNLGDLASKAAAAQMRAWEAEALLALLSDVIADQVAETDLPGGYLTACVAMRMAKDAAILMGEVNAELLKAEKAGVSHG